MQCVERGILLKTLFDSYVRLADLIFTESMSLRRQMAANFASVFEKQLKLHEADLERQMKITVEREKQIEQMKDTVVAAERRAEQVRNTNKKVLKVALRNQKMYEAELRNAHALDKQVKFLEERVMKMQESLDPGKLDIAHKDMKRQLERI